VIGAAKVEIVWKGTELRMKKATLYALISSSVILFNQVVVSLMQFTIYSANSPWSRILEKFNMWENSSRGIVWIFGINVAATIGWASLIIFFATLFRNQHNKVILFVLFSTSLNLLNSAFFLVQQLGRMWWLPPLTIISSIFSTVDSFYNSLWKFLIIFISFSIIILWASLIIFFKTLYKNQRTKKVILFALLLALVGCLLYPVFMLLLIPLMVWESLSFFITIFYVASQVIGFASLVIFFATLFQNQKRNKEDLLLD